MAATPIRIETDDIDLTVQGETDPKVAQLTTKDWIAIGEAVIGLIGGGKKGGGGGGGGGGKQKCTSTITQTTDANTGTITTTIKTECTAA